MRALGFRGVLAVWTLTLVSASLAATGAVAVIQTYRLAREEALDRARRGLARGLEAARLGLPADGFEEPDGVELSVRARAQVESEFADPRVALWRRALDGGVAAALVGGEVGAIAVRPLPGDPPPGVLEARVPSASIRARVSRFATRAAVAGGLLVGLAVLASLAVARRLGRPVARLATAAASLGRGDLLTPLPAGEAGELGALARTLESMRLRLLEVTGEAERNRSELEAVLASVSEGVFAVDRDRRIRYLSPRAEALLGVGAATAIGSFCGDVLRPEPVDGERPCEASCPILQARFRGPVRTTEILGCGSGPWVARLSSSPPAGSLQVQILRPETADEAARRARDAVVADLAHELKTPLAAQRASLELLRERLAGGESETVHLVAAVEAGALRLQRLIDNLLESVRIESGELAIRRAPVELDEVVEEAIGTTAPLLAKRGQRLEVALPYPLPTLFGDAPRLVQALVNLVANASKFAPAGTEVSIGGAVGEARVALWVEDEGPGLAPAELSRLTGRFRRGAGSVEPGEEGSGLGLWITRSIAERHGGSLQIERRQERTRVTLDLPVAESAA